MTEIENFKTTADKIKVELNECEIKTNNYTEQIEKPKNHYAQALDTLYDSSKNINNVNINQAMLVFQTERNGKNEYFYSSTIYKDETTLRFKLNRQKETYIYIDKENKNNYYFDLEFLNE